jgi:hypothetical protein
MTSPEGRDTGKFHLTRGSWFSWCLCVSVRVHTCVDVGRWSHSTLTVLILHPHTPSAKMDLNFTSQMNRFRVPMCSIGIANVMCVWLQPWVQNRHAHQLLTVPTLNMCSLAQLDTFVALLYPFQHLWRQRSDPHVCVPRTTTGLWMFIA